MSISMALNLFSPPATLSLHSSPNALFSYNPPILSLANKMHFLLFPALNASSADNGGATVAVDEPKEDEKLAVPEAKKSPVAANGAAAAAAEEAEVVVTKFQNPKWVGGTWDLKQFQKDGKTNWDAVIDAEARRRKFLELNPESSSNDDLVVFDTSIVPWWAWVKRFHLPEAELLNGRAAMVGFFMAYLVDSLTGVGLVDQMGNFLCKTLLFVAVSGVLLVRKNEDLDNLKKLIEETTFYDKQWQASWQDENSKNPE